MTIADPEATSSVRETSAEPSTEALLRVEGLAGGYGRIPILRGLSFQLRKGEVVGILGHNGMGKSTLLRTLMGYLPATGGTVAFAGRDLTRASTTARARAGMGFVPQGREIFPGLSVRENLRMGCLLGGPEADTIADILDLFPRLKAYLDRLGGALSGGEQQLLSLARCLCGRPKVLLLDEPTEGIQPSIIEEIIELLRGIGRERGLTILLVEQNLAFIASLSHRVLILRRGLITRELSAHEAQDRSLITEFTGMA